MSRPRLVKRLRGLRPTGFLRNVAVIAGGTAATQLIVLLVTPILTRIYTPDAFGTLAVYISLLGMFTVIGSLRYEHAIPLPRSTSTAANILALSVTCLLVVVAMLAISVSAFPDLFIGLVGNSDLRPYIWLLPVGTLMVGLYSIFHFWALRIRKFGLIARTKLAQGLATAISQVGLGLVSASSLGLIVGQILGESTGSFSLARRSVNSRMFKVVSIRKIKGVARRFRQFPILGAPSALLDTAGLQLPAVLLAMFFGVEAAGWFMLSKRIIGAPINLIGRSVGQVFLAEAAILARTDMGAMRKLFITTAKRLFVVTIAPLVLIVWAGPIMFSLVFGPEWSMAGVYTRLLAFMLIGQAVVSPLSQTFAIVEAQSYALGLNFLKATLAFLAFWLPFQLNMTAEIAILSYSLGMFLYYLLVFLFSLHVTSKRQRDPREVTTITDS